MSLNSFPCTRSSWLPYSTSSPPPPRWVNVSPDTVTSWVADRTTAPGIRVHEA